MTTDNSKHIINKQIIEIHLSKEVKNVEIQEAISKLYTQEFTPIISALLDQYFNTKKEHFKIEHLSIDLGEVSLENITAQFSKQLNTALLKITNSETLTPEITVKDTTEKTPFKAIGYYLIHGRLPWWSNNTKLYIREQLDVLLDKPTDKFKNMLVILQTEASYLKRYVHVFSEQQLLKSIEIVTGISSKEIVTLKKEIVVSLRKHTPTNDLLSQKVTSMFYTILFKEVAAVKDIEILKTNILKSIAVALEISINSNNLKIRESYKELFAIRLLIKQHQKKHIKNKVWQHYFKEAQHIINAAPVVKLPILVLQKFRQLLENLSIKEKRVLIKNSTLQEVTVALLLPIKKELIKIDKEVKEFTTKASKKTIETDDFNFEETDFITIENGGLVLVWPFLQRFFENLELLEAKSFVDEIARNKAVSILHYLCNSEESELFEGLLPLTKILCGIGIETPVEQYFLSEEEKEIAATFLEVIIEHGKCWGTISKDGFRTSYLFREASLRTRDDHWLVQVKKETYDIVLQKLPWSFNAIKLPWMEKLVMVEWM